MSDRHALIVGIDDYDSDPLPSCVKDARDVASVLQMDEYGFETKLLTDASATRRNIMQELLAIQLLQPKLFLFYFSGHGCLTQIGAYLVTVDGQPLDEGIGLDQLGKMLALFTDAGASVVGILDCCHAGACPWNLRPIARPHVEETMSGLSTSRVLLAACRPDEFAYAGNSDQHSLFTHHLLDGMLGNAADEDGAITAMSLYEFTCRPFEQITGQTPVIRSDVAGRIVLAKGFEPRLRKPLDEDLARQLESEAGQYLDDFTRRTSVGYELWRRQGYIAACDALSPLIRWFDGRLRDNPELRKRPKFIELRSAAIARLATLANVDPGTKLRAGKAVGTLETRLGEGSFGAVWKVKVGSSESPYLAYKIYHPHELSVENKVARFERGYRAMRQLDHPQIVKVHEFTACPVGFFMDFIGGPNLRDLSPGYADPQSTVQLLLTVAETLVHAHGRTVIHRDIKPENIIVTYHERTDSWIPHLTDFDLAWFSTATKLTKDAIGTTFYAAPEQLANPLSKASHKETVDVYSFGQLSYFVVMRSDPVPLGVADNKKALEKRLANWPSERAARTFFDLYSDCSEFDPGKRPQNFSDIVDRLAKVLHYFRSANEKEPASSARFVHELVFSMAGLDPGPVREARSEFHSRSGRTNIFLTVKSIKATNDGEAATIEAQFRPTEGLAIVGRTNEKARILLNSRIDEALSKYEQSAVRRRSGRQGAFEVYVDMIDVPLNMGSVQFCRPILSRVIEVMERS